MSTIAYSDWKRKLRAELWPYPGEPKSLRPVHDGYFNDAMIDLGKWVECLQANHTSVFPFNCTMVECAKTLIPAPQGIIKRIFTIANSDWCNKVFYRSASFTRVECLANILLMNWVSPTGTPIQQGILTPTSESDSDCGRSRTGYYAIRRKRLYIAPWIQSNESVIIEWDGYKLDWNDADLLDQDYWTREVEAAVKSFVRWQHKQNHSEDVLQAKISLDEYRERRADLMYWCEQRIKERENEVCDEERLPTLTELESEEVPDAAAETPIAIIGDYGYAPAPGGQDEVAALVESWNPKAVITTGDNRYTETSPFAVSILDYYEGLMSDDMVANKLWPSIGNHDYDNGAATLVDWAAMFTLPNNGRYYTVRYGSIQFFILNTVAYEPDGYTQTSIQAEWLRVMLANSTAPWKIVVGHYPPYTNGSHNPGVAALRWPYDTWGADLMLSGHSHTYERLEVAGFPYIVNGLGGAIKDVAFVAPGVGVTVHLQYLDDWGAIKMIADASALRLQFINSIGTIIDDVTYTKVAGATIDFP